MRKSKIILLILLMLISLCGIKSYANTSVDINLKTSIPAAASITKTSVSGDTQTVNPATGTHNGLRSEFTLQTNGSDSDFDFILTSAVTAGADVVSAFGNSGNYIVFTHKTADVTLSAVNDAKSGGSNNRNVIAYPAYVNVVNPITSTYKAGDANYGECFQILVNGQKEGIVTYIINGTPVPGTYSMADQSGTYQATVTLTAIGK